MSKSRRQPAARFESRGASRGLPRPAAPGRRRRVAGGISPNRQRGFAGGCRPYDYAVYEAEPATPEYLARLFARHRFGVTDRQLERFWLLYDLLRRDNARLDLTRIMGIEATVLKHFVDSGVVLDHVDLAGPVLDIGTGPGFPGLPLAILRPETAFILAESRGKRVAFLEEAVRALGLDNVELFPRSVRQDSRLGAECGRPVRDVVTRALEAIPPTLERILPFVEEGAKVVFMKGPNCNGEIAAADRAYTGAYVLAGDIRYDLPGSDQRRRLVVYRRCKTRR